MATNAGWPEAFGFSVSGGAPVVIGAVEEGGSAQQAGLQPGDVIVELDGENVQQWSKEEVLSRARQATKVPPSLVVISRVRRFEIPRGSDGGFGITLRGDCPVFIRSVDFHSPARAAGVRSGDLLLELNGQSVRHSSKLEVLEQLKRARRALRLVVIAGGLKPTAVPSSWGRRGRRGRYLKARAFHSKINYYLLDEEERKTHLLTLLRLYAKDRDVDSLASSLDLLLETPIHRRLLTDIRAFLHHSHRARFDVLVSYSRPTSLRRGSVDALETSRPRPLGETKRDAPWRSSMPNLTKMSTGERLVRVDRGRGGFGFSLSGNAPVFIRSVDPTGAAGRAGLRAGDHILEINGLNVRTATHSHVVRLLKGSGTRPSLLVSTHPPQRQGAGPTGRRGSTASMMGTDARKHSNAFKEKMEQVLLQDEREHVVQQLSQFSHHKDLPGLVQGLGAVLANPNKMVLFHYICQLLPEETQAEFDRTAATFLNGEQLVVRSSEGTEGVGDLLFRVQGGRLPPEGLLNYCSRLNPEVGGLSRRVSSSQFHPADRARGGGAGIYDDDDDIPGEELVLQDTPIRQVGQQDPSEGSPEDSSPPERMDPEERRALKIKRESLENTPVGQNLSALLNGGTPKRRPSSEKKEGPQAATPTDVSTVSVPFPPNPPPNPPPTPQAGVGGVPIPPPPPPSLPDTSSQSHLKRVNWEKVHGAEGTIWRELSGLEEALDYCELEKQFASQQPKDAAKAKNKQPSILEPRKAYNLSILLGHLKLSFERIREAVLSCDDSTLSEQHLKQMEAFAPNKKECLGFARYYDNPSILSLPDRFSCEMSTIPCYRERLKAMIFRLHFREKVEEIKPDLEAICLASVQVQTSKHFKRILEIVLALGNYMNAGNMRVGGAQGFRITFLTQLRGLRTTDNKSTLLHFLVNMVERKFPQALEFTSDVNHASRAARVSGQTLEVEISELTQGLKDIRRDVRVIRSQEEVPGDHFEEVMTAFLSAADQRMGELLSLYSRMKQEYLQAIKFFGEDPSKMRIDDFFGKITAFITDFERALQENRTAREQEVYRERRMKEREEMTKRRASQKVSSRMVPESEGFDLKRELEARKSRTIDIAALERGRERKSAASGQFPDLRHHLRKTEQPPRWEEEEEGSGQQWLEDLLPPLHELQDEPLLEYDSETHF